MRILVVLFAIAMPIVAWLTNTGTFGPDNGTMSDRYPTLLIASGYAFSIWALIFLYDLIYAGWQITAFRKTDPTLARIAPYAAAGFACTTLWMPMFAMSQFWLCLLLIFTAFACLLRSVLMLSEDALPIQGQRHWAWKPLSIHAGWLALAAFLNLAQVIVAYKLLPTDDMLSWSIALFVFAAALLLFFNHRMRGNIPFSLAAVWALVAVYVKQSDSTLQGSQQAAWIALLIAVVLAIQTVILHMRKRSERVSQV
ncbi:hypothetical protein G7069_06695 [Lysobacter sp. HDW10]|uniref:hypothetical protein n=1 Tax=Lysobacter sp. HDW10 TaxID=2714936 RepID=UPI00140A0E72|nr:hypothetical protein [Lysobacter sp. HDW10]QIK81311.1 hypothetical protein G7069_06695 [Lysobacter sp. HDW10]